MLLIDPPERHLSPSDLCRQGQITNADILYGQECFFQYRRPIAEHREGIRFDLRVHVALNTEFARIETQAVSLSITIVGRAVPDKRSNKRNIRQQQITSPSRGVCAPGGRRRRGRWRRPGRRCGRDGRRRWGRSVGFGGRRGRRRILRVGGDCGG